MSQEATVSGNKSLAIASLQSAVRQAVEAHDWVVVVYPSADTTSAARNVLSAMVPDGSTAGGRTTLVPGGGRISVVCALEKPFRTDETLSVMFSGWADAPDKAYAGMTAWRSLATDVIGTEGSRGA